MRLRLDFTPTEGGPSLRLSARSGDLVDNVLIIGTWNLPEN